MTIADFISQGIGPSGDVPHFITMGLDLAAAEVFVGNIIAVMGSYDLIRAVVGSNDLVKAITGSNDLVRAVSGDIESGS